MLGFGTHNQPQGTWSDDSSMVLTTVEWIKQGDLVRLNYEALMDKFSNWLMYGDYTPYGENFDNGIATGRAILNYAKGMKPVDCGGKTANSNGNGSLMRILPVALAIGLELDGTNNQCAEIIFDISSLTHGHARSKVGCYIYSKLVATMMNMKKNGVCGEKLQIVKEGLTYAKAYLDSHSDNEIRYESKIYGRLWEIESFIKLDEDEIKSTGYVLDTLEAAVWCFLNTDSFEECVLRAVNLGEDTDTVGAVAGGLAGLFYGFDSIPWKWLEQIAKREWIDELVDGFMNLEQYIGEEE